MVLRYARPRSTPAVRSEHVSPGRARGDRAEQARIPQFLAEIEEEAEPAMARVAGDVAVELTLGVPEGQSLVRRRDLANVLLPVVARLGQRRVPAVFGQKAHADVSTLRLGPVRPRDEGEPPDLRVRMRCAPGSPEWREQLWDACEAAVALGAPAPGPLRVELAFAVSSAWNWTLLWKPALDALGPLLGLADPENPWVPRSDRIVQLGLHRRTVGDLGRDVALSAWWAPAPG